MTHFLVSIGVAPLDVGKGGPAAPIKVANLLNSSNVRPFEGASSASTGTTNLLISVGMTPLKGDSAGPAGTATPLAVIGMESWKRYPAGTHGPTNQPILAGKGAFGEGAAHPIGMDLGTLKTSSG